MKIEIDREKHYQLVTVKTKADLQVAVAPKSIGIFPGYLVELEDEVISRVLMCEDYVRGEDVWKVNEILGGNLQAVVDVYRKLDCWKEED